VRSVVATTMMNTACFKDLLTESQYDRPTDRKDLLTFSQYDRPKGPLV